MPETHPPCPYCNNSSYRVFYTGAQSNLAYVKCLVCNSSAPAALGDRQAWLNWDSWAKGLHQVKDYQAD